jgi:hypothetical protein
VLIPFRMQQCRWVVARQWRRANGTLVATNNGNMLLK